MKPLEWMEAWAKARGFLRRRRSEADEETLEHLSWARFGNVETDFNPTRVGWHVATYPEIAEKGTVLVWLRPEDGHVDEWALTPLVAWLWAHAVDTGREVRRRCPDCEVSAAETRPDYRGEPDDLAWGQRCVWRVLTQARDARKGLRPSGPDSGWQNFSDHPDLRREALSLIRKHPQRVERRKSGLDRRSWNYRIRRLPEPCPTCSTKGPPIECSCVVTRRRFGHPGPNPDCRDCDGDGHLTGQPGKPTGYLDTPLARVVCEGALWRPVKPAPGFYCNECFRRDSSEVEASWREFAEPERGACDEHHDPTARTVLAVAADEYQDKGAPWATGLALWLSGAPCEACKGEGRAGACDMGVGCDQYGACYADVNGAPERCGALCKSCHGQGTALAAYVAQQIDSVRTLTEDKVIDPGPSDTTNAVVGGPGRVLGSDR